MVYVLNKEGQPLMPTEKHGKVRHLLKSGRAKVARRTPFTIMLLYDTPGKTQPVTLGIDAGSKTVGLSATAEKKELFAAELKPRNDVVKLLADRRALRQNRRSRKTRYRPPRFLNRKKSKPEGWRAPSILVKVNNHMQGIKLAMKILPITKIIVETAEFDTQVLKALIERKPLPVGTEYRFGEQYGFYNVRQYILWRDGYTCASCGGKSKDNKLLVTALDGNGASNAPNNLVCVCSECAAEINKGKKPMPKKREKAYRGLKDAAFMGIMRDTLFKQLETGFPDTPIKKTVGAVTKGVRESLGMRKSHINDAFCIAGNLKAERSDETWLIVPKRTHNRRLHEANIRKGQTERRRTQADKYVKGFQIFDRAKTPDGKEGFIFGRRKEGHFELKTADGTAFPKTANPNTLVLAEKRKPLLLERRKAL
jgi:N6-L-threonylcarbamoyladenine synthase